MLLSRITSEGLAHHSYVLGEGGDAAVVDPRRDVDAYLDLARDRALRIRWILETHRNEDFVSGAAALGELTGATVLHGPSLAWGYGTTARDGDRVDVGRLRVRVIEAPGHTDESLTFAVADTKAGDDPVLAFTGDALFVGEVGRTDLYGPAEAPRLAATLHASLVERILPLGDGVVLYPAHGGGSVCGGRISDRDVSTLGFERAHNPALRARDREVFVAQKLAEKWVRPPYFERMEGWNRDGTAPRMIRPAALTPLSPGELDERLRAGAMLVDLRMPQAFAGGHVPGSLNAWRAGLSGYLAWAARPDDEIALILPEDASVDAVARTLARIGYDRIAGYLRGGFDAWQNEGRPVESTATIDTERLRARLARGDRDLVIVDVRKPDEVDEGTIAGARPIFVGDLERRMHELSGSATIITMCSVGHRGSLAASILQRRGRRAVNYLGGYRAWCSAPAKARAA